MRHTIELSEDGEAALRRLAGEARQDAEALLRALAEAALAGEADADAPVRSTAGVMGGDACVRRTRVPVWMLVGYKGAGFSDERILANFPGLTAADLIAAWDHNAAHGERVRAERLAHEEAE